MTASDSSSSAPSPPEGNLPAAGLGLLGGLPAALLAGGEEELLAPLRMVGDGVPGEEPPPASDRGALAADLARVNDSYGHPRSQELAAKLAEPATRVVVTGQQPGLFGGPLYTLSKAVAAARWAERLEAEGVPAVALFWAATEDHDFREISRAGFLGTEGPKIFDLGEDPAPLVPVGMRTFGPAVDQVLAELPELLPGDRFAAWTETLKRWYRPDVRFGEAFARLLVHLLGERCPLVVDAMLPTLKRAQRPWLRRLIEGRRELDEAFRARDRIIQEHGHDLQVTPQPGASPLFLLQAGRRLRIEWRGDDRWTLRGADGGEQQIEKLLQAVEENPAVVSPGVLARPAIQDAVFGTTVNLVGPGELAYLPQAAPAYELLGIPPPRVALRPQALVVEGHQLAKLAEEGLGLAELLAPDFDLDAAVAGSGETAFLEPAGERLEDLLDTLRSAALELDPNLEGPWNKTAGQMRKALEIFSGKVTATAARRDQVARRRLESLHQACRPLGSFQERLVSTAHFPGKHGERLVEAFFEQLELDPATLQVIVL